MGRKASPYTGKRQPELQLTAHTWVMVRFHMAGNFTSVRAKLGRAPARRGLFQTCLTPEPRDFKLTDWSNSVRLEPEERT